MVGRRNPGWYVIEKRRTPSVVLLDIAWIEAGTEGTLQVQKCCVVGWERQNVLRGAEKQAVDGSLILGQVEGAEEEKDEAHTQRPVPLDW